MMTYTKLWLKEMQSNETWFQFMYWKLAEKQSFIQQLIWSFRIVESFKRLKWFIITKLKFAEEIQACQKVVDFLISSF